MSHAYYFKNKTYPYIKLNRQNKGKLSKKFGKMLVKLLRCRKMSKQLYKKLLFFNAEFVESLKFYFC